MKIDLSNVRSVVILTGAGISAASGLETFRAATGTWNNFDYRTVATPAGFVADPALVHEFYNMRRAQAAAALPNAAHAALARLEATWKGDLLVVTQNVDALHEAAGTAKITHMHGKLSSALCQQCGARSEWTGDMGEASKCPNCGDAGYLRPDVVWFGEMPYHMDRIEQALIDADLFVSIGTSGTVYPAANFVRGAKSVGAKTVELNLEPSENNAEFDDSLIGPAVETVPAFVAALLAANP